MSDLTRHPTPTRKALKQHYKDLYWITRANVCVCGHPTHRLWHLTWAMSSLLARSNLASLLGERRVTATPLSNDGAEMPRSHAVYLEQAPGALYEVNIHWPWSDLLSGTLPDPLDLALLLKSIVRKSQTSRKHTWMSGGGTHFHPYFYFREPVSFTDRRHNIT